MDIFGRLHPLLLHLPIGFLILAFLMVWADHQKKDKTFEPAIHFALKWGMWSAIASAISGYVLSLEGGYDENLLFWHQYLGILTAIFAIGIYFLNQKKASKQSIQRIFFPAFASLITCLLITGHLGGSLTHGTGFLTEPFSSKAKAVITDLDKAIVFEDFIQPIFKKKCNSCHNESKLKGELLLTNQLGIQKGGATGALFIEGDPKNSLMMRRIHLPVEEKEHMPPDGKTPLTQEEISLLEWWITEGGDFEKTVEQSNPSNSIQAILNKYVEPADQGVFDLNISPASEKSIQNLKTAGFKVYPIAQESPFLEVVWKGKDSLEAKDLKPLKKVANQVIKLDLSNTSLTDDLFEIMADLPHLQKLSVQKTAITDAAFQHLKNHDYLEYLNAYQTNISDAGLQSIFQLKRLKNLFLWQTAVSDSMVVFVQQERPKLAVNTGVSLSIFGDAQLKPPIIIADNDIFSDSLAVELKVNFSGVDLYYTLDGSEPDSTSSKYDTIIYLTQTTNLKVIAQKEGWKRSEVANQFFVRAKYQPLKVNLSQAPNERYAAKGGRSLVDFKKGTTVFTDGNWLGYQKTHFTATLDLGKMVEVSRITVSALEAPASWIYFPKGVEISVSTNGNKYKKVISATYPTATESMPVEIKNFSESFSPTTTRFVKVQVKSNLVNPDWHPNPGEPAWVFVDEILVE